MAAENSKTTARRSPGWRPTLKVWDLEQGALLSTLEGHHDAVWAVAVTPDGRRAVSGSSDLTLRLWDLQTYAELARFEADRPLLCCAATPDGRAFVAGDEAGHIHLVEIAPEGGFRLTAESRSGGLG